MPYGALGTLNDDRYVVRDSGRLQTLLIELTGPLLSRDLWAQLAADRAKCLSSQGSVRLVWLGLQLIWIEVDHGGWESSLAVSR